MTARLDRRCVVKGAAALALAPLGLQARDALATTPHFDAALAALLDGRVAERSGLKIDAPEVAENGNMVPVTIAVESPMTVGDHVQEIVLLATRNPVAEIARFFLTPAAGEAIIGTRVRLAESQDVVALARLDDGTLLQASRLIRVTIGGCGAS